MTNRITYSRRHSYRTKSNKIRAVKTPGGKLVGRYLKKRGSGVKCGDCGTRLQGIPCARPKEFKNMHKREKSVSRAYGGSRCAGCVRKRIVRAFLIEEQKIVKRVLMEKMAKAKAAKAK